MVQKLSRYQGCLLGLAVGDAMGSPIDKKCWEEICQDYGPNGLLGYDLVNGCAEITSYTQLAAFVSNGLLLGMSRAVAAEFSFYMAIPVMFGASALKLLGGASDMGGSEWGILLIGSVVSFAVSMVVIKFLLSYIRKHDFKAFGYYRIVLGLIVLALIFADIIPADAKAAV